MRNHKLAMAIGLIALLLVGFALLHPNSDEGMRDVFDERAAAGSLRTFYLANASYSATYPKLGYARELSFLGGTAPCSASPQTACLIDPALSSGRKANYTFTYRASTADKDGIVRKYAIWADPSPTSHSKWYFLDETGMIRFEKDKRPTSQSPMLE